jgi:hypothetical protein
MTAPNIGITTSMEDMPVLVLTFVAFEDTFVSVFCLCQKS